MGRPDVEVAETECSLVVFVACWAGDSFEELQPQVQFGRKICIFYRPSIILDTTAAPAPTALLPGLSAR